ncbi:hypothetical protein G6F37_000089 [Rhizopus arrhizus]|nr:hypothetical protein G6F38_001679 [Rhizopus arrhizus]KAG1164659.1 hypothetical protein G6F37_000089 [Rhizopus arrhizus]
MSLGDHHGAIVAFGTVEAQTKACSIGVRVGSLTFIDTQTLSSDNCIYRISLDRLPILRPEELTPLVRQMLEPYDKVLHTLYRRGFCHNRVAQPYSTQSHNAQASRQQKGKVMCIIRRKKNHLGPFSWFDLFSAPIQCLFEHIEVGKVLGNDRLGKQRRDIHTMFGQFQHVQITNIAYQNYPHREPYLVYC